ncbi:MAG: polyprenyl synthetase family protein [Paramuribaculum sp.]|nr:polyprenyl synthetase family protein [Paramuribaculum sp.]MDE7470503.1 polyprenyl synthetase family protein [Paramuribaculum sp.]
MTTYQEIQQSIAPELGMLHERITSALSSRNTLMNTVVEGYLKSKGKLIRPILVILTAKLLGSVNTHVISAAAAVEMLHNASLIHDDVVDDSSTRRGRPTVNAVWDNHIAVLVGDYFVSGALQQAISTGDLRIVDSLARLGRMLSLGEIDQIYNARYQCLDEQAYYNIISHKTASLFVSCIEMGAYAVGVDDHRLDIMRRFAELLGLCFQIRDDVFDYFPDADGSVGKPTANDLREGKITLPLLYALTRTDSADAELQKKMAAMAHRDQLSGEEIDTLYEYARANGGIDYAYSSMERMHREAVELLAEFDSSSVEPFKAIFEYIIARRK